MMGCFDSRTLSLRRLPVTINDDSVRFRADPGRQVLGYWFSSSCVPFCLWTLMLGCFIKGSLPQDFWGMIEARGAISSGAGDFISIKS
jgi:hypothetical protein